MHTSTKSPAAGNESAQRPSPLLRAADWAWLAVLSALFVALFFNFLWRMLRIATNAPGGTFFNTLKNLLSQSWNHDWSHAVFVPLISIYYIHQNRDRLAALPARVYWPALPFVFVGVLAYAFGITPGRNDILQGYSMVFTLFAGVLFLLGPSMMRMLWFPIAFLLFGVKISDRIWDQLAWQLQLFAAKASAVLLNLVGIDASVRGSTIELYRGVQFLGKLNVAEACSGLRMLMAFMALGVAVAFLADRAGWQRVVMVISTVPIAIAVNVLRVTVTGLLFLVNPELAQGSFHTLIGMLMLIPALLAYLLLGWVLDHIFIDDESSDDAVPSVKAIPPQPVDENKPTQPRTVALGLLAGVALSVLVAFSYIMLSATLSPGVFGAALTTSLAAPLLVLSVLVFLALIWLAQRVAQKAQLQRSTFAASLLAVVLLLSVPGLWLGVLRANDMVLHKLPIPVQRPLVSLPETLGTWQLLREDPPLSEELIEALGTRQYVSRYYFDTAGTTAGGKPTNDSVVKLHVAYYTGMPDTVPHVPERCFVAGGLIYRGKQATEIELQGSRYREDTTGEIVAFSRLAGADVLLPKRRFEATQFTFAAPDAGEAEANVVYFFVANGRLLATPDQVRLLGFNPRDRYSYYCKIEIGLFGIADKEQAVNRAASFLSAAMPEIMACLPDWRAVESPALPPSQVGAAAGSEMADDVSVPPRRKDP